MDIPPAPADRSAGRPASSVLPPRRAAAHGVQAGSGVLLAEDRGAPPQREPEQDRAPRSCPTASSLVAKSPAKVSRTASTIQRNGMKSLTRCSHSGPSVIGSRIPESSRTGIITMLMTGAITSSLLVVSASALDAAAQAPPTSRVSSDADDHAARPGRACPSRSRGRPGSAPARTAGPRRASAGPTSRAVRLAGVTRSASITPSRHSPISPKPAKNAPNMPSWTSRPGPGTCRRSRTAEVVDERLEQRAEQHQVEDRLHHADKHPRGVAQVHPDLAAEDDEALADERHCSAPSRTGAGRICSGLGVAQRPAGEGEEDVVEGGTVHLDGVEGDAGAVELAQQAGHGAARPAGPGHGRGGRRPRRSSAIASARSRRRSRRLGSATSRSTWSPETAALRFSAVSLAMILPWSMIMIRSLSASASSR